MTDSPTKKPRWKKILLVQIILWPVLLLLADLTVNLVSGYDSEATRIEISEIIERMNSGVPDPARDKNVEDQEVVDLSLHPYTGFGSRGMLSAHTGEFKKARKPGPEGEYRIMILGGSVAGGFGSKRSEGTGNLRKLLKLDPRFEGRTIRFIAQGFGSFKQPQQLNLANFMFAWGVRPHAVINLDGFNEVVLTLQNARSGINPTYPSFARWAHLSSDWGTETNTILDILAAIREPQEKAVELASRGLKFKLHKSSILGPLLLEGVSGHQWRHAQATKEYTTFLRRRPSLGPLAGPKFPNEDEIVLSDAVRMWSESSRSLHALCEERGIFYLNVLQPTLHDTGSKVPTLEERRKGQASATWKLGASAGYPLLRAAGAKLSELGVNFYDASGVFKEVEETLYFDACHFNQFGNAVLGKAVAEAFLELLPEGELPE